MIYTLDDTPLSAFGLIPVKASGSNIAIGGIWDLPKRSGTCYYDWLDENGVEPYVEEADIAFDGRDITIATMLWAESRTDALGKTAALRTWLNEISSPFNLHCEAGDFVVRFAGTEDSYRGKGKVEIVLKFREDAPVLTGAVMPIASVHSGGIDGYSWVALGVVPGTLEGAFLCMGRKEKDTTGVVSAGGTQMRSVTLSGWVTASSLADFTERVRVLYSLFGGPGLRTVIWFGETFQGFACEGFTVSEIYKLSEKMIGKLSVKIIVV